MIFAFIRTLSFIVPVQMLVKCLQMQTMSAMIYGEILKTDEKWPFMDCLMPRASCQKIMLIPQGPLIENVTINPQVKLVCLNRVALKKSTSGPIIPITLS